MNEEHKPNSRKKLAQAMQDAAIGSIGEDINDICKSIEKITNDLPIHVKSQLFSLKEDITSLERALESIPEQFDNNFTTKMNKILDVTSEVEKHTETLNRTIKADNSEQIEKQAEQYAKHFNRNIEGYRAMSAWDLFKYGGMCTVIGATFGGMLSALLVWVIFPKLF